MCGEAGHTAASCSKKDTMKCGNCPFKHATSVCLKDAIDKVRAQSGKVRIAKETMTYYEDGSSPDGTGPLEVLKGRVNMIRQRREGVSHVTSVAEATANESARLYETPRFGLATSAATYADAVRTAKTKLEEKPITVRDDVLAKAVARAASIRASQDTPALPL